MKRIIVAVVVLCGFALASAQELNFGIKGGVNVSTLVGSADSKLFIAANVAGFVEIQESKKFSFQPELLLSIQGARTSGYTIRLKYLCFPLMTKYKLTEKCSILAGPQIGILTAAKYSTYEEKSRYNSIDFGVNFGVEYDLSENVFVEARYYKGFIPTIKYLDPGESETKNAVVQLSVGYRF